MSRKYELKPPEKQFYGTTTVQQFGYAKATLPVQVLGLTPANEDNSDPDRPCFSHHTWGGDKVDFLFDWPAPFVFDSFTYPYFLKKIILGGVDLKISLSDTNLAETFPFGTWPDYPNRSGIIINWAGVLAEHGAGEYFFFIGEGDPVVADKLLYGGTDDELLFGGINDYLKY